MNIKSLPAVDQHLDPFIEEEMKIINLINENQYLLDYALILFEDDGYRLVVNRGGEIITNKNYNTVKGAKRAFRKFFSFMARDKTIRAKWSTYHHT